MASTIFFKSKLEPFRIIPWGLLALFIIPSVTALALAYFTDYASHLKHDDQTAIFAVPWAFLLLGGWGLYMAVTERQTLVVYGESIHIGSRIISYQDIENIDVLARKELSFLSNGDDEFVVITLKSGDELNTRVRNYTNGNQFRAICQKIKENIAERVYHLNSFTQPAYVDVSAINFSSLINEKFEVFKSRPFRFFALLYPPFLWSLAIAVVVEVQTIKNSGAIILIAVSVFMATVGFYMVWVILKQQNRFLLSSNYLVIKSNVFLPSAVIPVKEIKRITPYYVYTSRGMPRGDDLLVITSDYRLHTFGIPASYKPLEGMIAEVNKRIQ